MTRVWILLTLFCGFTPSAFSKTFFIFDIDDTLLKNFGNYYVYPSHRPETPFSNPNRLPEIAVPIHDFEGWFGPRIQDRLGYYQGDTFIPGDTRSPVTLSNGVSFIPGYYRLDPHLSYRDFRDSGLVDLFAQKWDQKEAFVLRPTLDFYVSALWLSLKKPDHVFRAVLTDRGNAPADISRVFSQLDAHLFKAGRTTFPALPERAGEIGVYPMNHPDAMEFEYEKTSVIQRIWSSLSQTQLEPGRDIHSIVMFENSLKHLKRFEDQFTQLTRSGLGRFPVQFILVNTMDQESFQSLTIKNWDDSGLKTLAPPARVQVFTPNRIGIERLQDMEMLWSRLKITPPNMTKILNSQKVAIRCVDLLSPRH